MYVRAIALALPILLGVAACKTSSTQGSTETASSERSGQTTEATASTSTQTGQETSGTASGTTSGTTDPGATASSDLKGHASDQIVSGRLKKVSEEEIAIESDTGEEKTLELVEQTVVTVDGRDASHQDLQEGQEVRASFNTVEGRDVAVQIQAGQEAGSYGSPGMGSDPSSTGSGMPSDPGMSPPGSGTSTDPGMGGTGSGTTTDPGMGGSTGSGTTTDPGMGGSTGSGTTTDPGTSGSTGSGTTTDPGTSGSTGSGTTTEPEQSGSGTKW